MVYDVIILGAGPAGLTAGLYAGRSRLKTLIIEKGQDGGQIAITNEIENYPGAQLEGESGPSLIARMTQQAAKFGCERVSDTIKEVQLDGEIKKLIGAKGEYEAKAVILATGAYPRPIGCENEQKFVGKGISFEGFVVKNVKTGELTRIEADPDDGILGLFGFIGLLPQTALFEGILDMENGYVVTDADMHTNLPGVFAAGDLRKTSLRQVVTATADGAIAAMQAEKYIAG